MLTAEEVYKASVQTVDEHLTFIERRIMAAIKKNQLKVRIEEMPYVMWTWNTNMLSRWNKPAWETLEKLKELGYEIEPYDDSSALPRSPCPCRNPPARRLHRGANPKFWTVSGRNPHIRSPAAARMSRSGADFPAASGEIPKPVTTDRKSVV